MIDDTLVEAFNARPKIDLNNIKKMSAGQLDKVKTYGTQAENLLSNRDFALFVHHFKFEVMEALAAINGHAEEDNTRRVALSNQLSGMDGFIATLKRAKYFKDRVVSQQVGSLDPNA